MIYSSGCSEWYKVNVTVFLKSRVIIIKYNKCRKKAYLINSCDEQKQRQKEMKLLAQGVCGTIKELYKMPAILPKNLKHKLEIFSFLFMHPLVGI